MRERESALAIRLHRPVKAGLYVDDRDRRPGDGSPGRIDDVTANGPGGVALRERGPGRPGSDRCDQRQADGCYAEVFDVFL